jgi:hypothetical protein
MAESNQDAVASADFASAVPSPETTDVAATIGAAPLSVEAPKIETPASPDPIELSSLGAIEVEPARADAEVQPPSPDEAIAGPTLAVGERPSLLRRYAPFAATVALAIMLGAVFGAATTLELTGHADNSAAIAAVSAASTDEARALKDTVSRLNGELSKLKAGIEAANRASAAQLGKMAERLDRAEKAQAEPTAKLAKLAESLERLERRTATPATPAASAAAPDVTGSVASPDKPSRPPVAEGWTLLDYYAGRAVIENRNGTLFEVAPGSNLPGLGRVESIKRQDGRVVITTPKGIIMSSLETRRPSRYTPYRY